MVSIYLKFFTVIFDQFHAFLDKMYSFFKNYLKNLADPTLVNSSVYSVIMDSLWMEQLWL